MNKPLVSIITPCFNMAHCIFRLFDSILIQDYRPIEFILVNDGSDDCIDELVKEYVPYFAEKDIKFVFYTQENKGLAGAINTGLNLMTGDYFVWPDADDYLEPYSISKRVEVLINHPECGSVTGQAYMRKSNHLETYMNLLEESNQNHDKKIQFERMLNGEALFCPGCHMVRTSHFLKVNPLKTIYPARRGQNWQLLLPLYYAYPRAFIDMPVYNYLDFPNSMSSGDVTKELKLLRFQEHEEILCATLQMIEDVQKVDLHLYFMFIEDKYAKLRMEVAITYEDCDLFQQVYCKKQQNVGLDSLDKIAELRMKFPILRKPLDVFYRGIRYGKRFLGLGILGCGCIWGTGNSII